MFKPSDPKNMTEDNPSGNLDTSSESFKKFQEEVLKSTSTAGIHIANQMT